MLKISQKYFCPDCGAVQDDSAKFCSSCGAQLKRQTHQQLQNQSASQQPIAVAPSQEVSQTVQVSVPVAQLLGPSKKSRTVALFLCLLFGCLGFHRFYVGKGASGVLYFFTLGIFGLGVFIDFFVILFGGFRDFNNQIV